MALVHYLDTFSIIIKRENPYILQVKYMDMYFKKKNNTVNCCIIIN